MFQDRIIIYLSDIQLLYGISKSGACEVKKRILCALGKDKKKRLTIQEFCDYEGLELDKVKEKIQVR